MLANPDIPEAFELKGWYNNKGANTKIQSHSSSGGAIGREVTKDTLKTVAEIKEAQLGTNKHGDYLNFCTTMMYIKSDTISYHACPTNWCNKKMVHNGDNDWQCKKCEKLFTAPDHR
jgi:replication factor A1